jgi:hypothetical protein
MRVKDGTMEKPIDLVGIADPLTKELKTGSHATMASGSMTNVKGAAR